MIILDDESEAPPAPRTFHFDDRKVSLVLKPAGLADRVRARRLGVRAMVEAGNDQDVGGVAYSVSLIAHAVTAWDGVGDAKGKPIKPTPALVEKLLVKRQDIFDELDREYVLPFLQQAAEKNVSSVSPTGPSATAAKRTARRAAKPAQNARNGSTPRKPPKASRSGK